MKRLIPFVVVILVGCGKSDPIPTYDELKQFQLNCTHKARQLTQLKHIQYQVNFIEDPDQLNDSDRAYNALLKNHIWWFSYSCE
jgi:hypothetical protein